jgi:hypothetical protein
MECPECHARIPDMAKFCLECGAKLTSSGSVSRIEDSVLMRSPGAGGNYAPTINLSNKEQNILRCSNCEMEISNENKPLKCLECGTKFCDNCEKWYRKEDRLRGEKPLCEKCYTLLQEKLSKESPDPHKEIKQWSKMTNENEDSRNFSLDDAYEFLRSKNLDSIAEEIKNSRDQFKSYTSTLRRAKVTSVLNNKGLLNEFIEKYWPSGKTKRGQARTQFWLNLYDRFKSSEGQDE